MTNDTYTIPIKEHAYLMIERTLDMIRNNIPAFQRYINKKADSKYGIIFIPHPSNSSINDVFTEYRFNDIQPTDIVLDIGANIGGFSLFVSKMVEHVYAVEPMLFDIIEKNVEVNNISNITVFSHALGLGMLDIPWEGVKNRHIIGKSLSELIYLCGGHIDFLKLDCEGGEWVIIPAELHSIRRIEAEIHNFDGKHNTSDFLKILDDAGFDYEYTFPRAGLLQVHAYKRKL